MMYIRTLLLLIILITAYPTQAQLKWYVSPETGLNNNQNSMSRGLSALEGLLSYTSSILGLGWSASGQFRSEFYGISDPDRIERYKLFVGFNRKIVGARWQISLNLNRHSFKYLNTSDFNLYFTRFSCDFPLTVSSSFHGSISLVKSKISNRGNGKGDAFIAELLYLKSVNPYFSVGGGLYTERYRITQNETGIATKYDVGKAGPVLSVDYLRIYVLRLQYRFLMYPDHPGHEHYLRFISGRIIQNRWPVFFMMDYYFRSALSPFPVRLNVENRIYVKAGYIITEQVEVYLKSGYFRDEFENSPETFTRWNFLIGVEIRS